MGNETGPTICRPVDIIDRESDGSYHTLDISGYDVGSKGVDATVNMLVDKINELIDVVNTLNRINK